MIKNCDIYLHARLWRLKLTYYTFLTQGGGCGEALPYISHIYKPPQRVWFLLRLGIKALPIFCLELGMVFKRTTGVYEVNYRFKFQMIKKEKEICKFEMDFKKSLCWCSNQSNFSSENGSGFLRWGLKMGVENDILGSEIGSGFGVPGSIPPPRFLRSTPPPPPPHLRKIKWGLFLEDSRGSFFNSWIQLHFVRIWSPSYEMRKWTPYLYSLAEVSKGDCLTVGHVTKHVC